MAQANEALAQVSLTQQAEARQLRAEAVSLKEQVATDPLTGLANRRRFDQFIGHALTVGGGPVSMLMIDADRFKAVNDTYGHATGDRALRVIAAVLKRLAPAGALAARFGGEEFALVLPGVDLNEAQRLAEQVRSVAERVTFAGDDGASLSLTLSVGVACNSQGILPDAPRLIAAADHAVYAAKRAGRNRVAIYEVSAGMSLERSAASGAR